jgi:O-antigen/teichoic acid export membrane protein
MTETGSRIGWNTLVSFLSSVGSRGVKLVGSIVFANIAGAAALGTLYVFMSLYRVGRRSMSLGMGQTVVTRVSEAKAKDASNEVGRIVATALAIRFLPLVVLSVAGYVFAGAIDGYVGLAGAWLYLLVALGATALLSTARAALSGLKRVDLSSSLQVSKDLGITVVQISLVLLGFGAFGLVVGFVGGILFAMFVSLVLVLPQISGLEPSVKRARSMVQFAKFTFLDTLVGGDQIWLDVLLLSFFVGTYVTQAQIGIYGVAYSISMFGFALSASIGRTILPEISDFATAGSDHVRDKTVRESLRYATVLSVPLAFGAVTVGNRILRDIFGFNSGHELLTFLTIGAIGFSAYQPLHQVFYGLDRPHWAFGISLSTAVTNGVLNLAFIPVFGTTGVAASTALAMWLALGMGYTLLHRVGIKNAMPIKSWLIQVGAATMMAVVVTGADSLLSNHSRMVTVALVCVGAITYISLLLAGEPPIRQRIGHLLS